MLLERGIVVSYETIRRWGEKFGPDYARRLRHKQPRRDDIWYLDEGLCCKLFGCGQRGIGVRHFAGEFPMFKGRHFDQSVIPAVRSLVPRCLN